VGSRRYSRALAIAALAAATAIVGIGPARSAPGAPVAADASYRVLSADNVSRGVDHLVVHRDDGPERVHVARIAASELGRLRIAVASGGLGSLEPTSSMCLRYHCVVAVNGDYYDALRRPVGGLVVDGELWQSAPPIAFGHVLFGLDRRPSATIEPLPFNESLVSQSAGTLGLWGVNRPAGGDAVMLFTPRWGSAVTPPEGALVLRLAVTEPRSPGPGGLVRLDGTTAGSQPLAPGQLVVVATGAGVGQLQQWIDATAGDDAAELRIDLGGTVDAIGGSPMLVRDGTYAFPDDAPGGATQGRQPRTLIGWNADGDLLLVTVDGRQPGYSVGLSLGEAARLLVTLGAVEGMNLDGGGSTTFVLGGGVANRPSDEISGTAGERPDDTALVVGPPEGFDFPHLDTDDGADACPPGAVPPARFADVPPSSVHQPMISCVVWWDVAQGRSAGIFAPSMAVNRGQMATFVARALTAAGQPLPAEPPHRFSDTSSSVHRLAIDQLAAIGVVSGRPDGTYRPTAPVTRAQVASLLVRAYTARAGHGLADPGDFFADDGALVQATDINAAAGAGLVAGTSPGLYQPAGNVRRDQMASFLARLLDRLIEDGLAGRR
jgi:hypothetical protein